MTPAEVQKAAADKNNKIRAVEIQLRQKVVNWFTESKPATYHRINNELITQAVANTNQVKFGVWAAKYDTEIFFRQPINIMDYDAATKVIMDEAHKQCNLIGEFIRAQGHNLVSVTASDMRDYGIIDIKCDFTFAPRAPNTN